MEKSSPPPYPSPAVDKPRRRLSPLLLTLVLSALLLSPGYTFVSTLRSNSDSLLASQNVVHPDILAKCASTKVIPGAPEGWADKRHESDRFVEGTEDVVIHNARLWTGVHSEDKKKWESTENGFVRLSKGIITEVGRGKPSFKKNERVIDADGAWVTPSLFDLHSHLGVDAAPALDGAADTNSVQAPIMPYLRSLDGFNTHDMAFKRTVAGGVTSSLVLPGSANNIGGQAFVFKLRPTTANTPTSMALELPPNIPNATTTDFLPW
ncbi:hypothetical protein BT69DRAFT_1355150, partial [Atractiella rhizophila]